METKVLEIGWQFMLVSWFGSLVLYFRLRNQNMETWRFCYFVNKKWVDLPAVNIVDIIAFTIIGSLVGALLTRPSTYPQAFAAGLGWLGLLGTPPNNTLTDSQVGGANYAAKSSKSE